MIPRRMQIDTSGEFLEWTRVMWDVVDSTTNIKRRSI